jgi:hypothetical protein
VKKEKIRLGPQRNTGFVDRNSPLDDHNDNRSTLGSALNILDYFDSDRKDKQPGKVSKGV